MVARNRLRKLGQGASKATRLKRNDEWVVKDIESRGYITENELNTIKHRLNHGKFDANQLDKLVAVGKITPEQTQKGLDWLKDQWKTPFGVERKNNPFGYREEQIIENFDHFTFEGFYEMANYEAVKMGIHNYVPLYEVHARDGSSFQYYVNGGEVSIVG